MWRECLTAGVTAKGWPLDFIFAGYTHSDLTRMRKLHHAGREWMPTGPHGMDETAMTPSLHEDGCTCRRCLRKAAEA